MQEKLRAAKHAFETKQYQASKDIILKIIRSNEYEHNHRLFIKLGDICVELRFNLLIAKNFSGANEIFHRAERVCSKPNINWSLCVGLARTHQLK